LSYSQIIRESRKKLGITQTDLTSPGISRVYITDIESGKATFQASIPNKVNRAFQIYKKLLEFSLIKNTPLDLNFDALFPENHPYFKIKSCYLYLLELKSVKVFNENLLSKSQTFIDYELENIKFYLIAQLAISYRHHDIDLSRKYFRIALISQKYNINKHNIEFYINIINHFIYIANDEINASVIVEALDYVITFSEKNALKINTHIYYHMALYNKIAFNFEESIKYLKIVEDTASLSQYDYIKCEIIKAGSYNSLNKNEEALDIFLQLISMDNDYNDLKMLYYGNCINFIVKNKLDQTEIVNQCIESLSYIVGNYEQKIEANTYSNLGQGYAYNNQYDQAYICFEKAFEVLREDKNATLYNLLMVITESFVTYMNIDKLDELIGYLKTVTTTTFTDKENILYMKVLLTLTHYDKNEKINDLLDPFIIKPNL